MTRIIYLLLLLLSTTFAKAVTNKCAPQKGEWITPISMIQGNITKLKNDQSPLINQYVWVEAVVSLSKQGAHLPNGEYDPQYKGFWIQEQKQDFDNRPNTSEGLFVFNSKFKVEQGDQVLLYAKVSEYNQVTQLQNVKRLTVCSKNNPVEKIKLTLPVKSLLKMESVEGMLVELNPLVISDFYATGYGLKNYGQMVLSSKLQFYPTELKSLGVQSFKSKLEEYQRDRIILDDGSSVIKPKYLPFPNKEGLSLGNPVAIGQKVKSLMGVVHGYKKHKMIVPSITPVFEKYVPQDITEFSKTKNTKIALMNLKNFFNGEGGDKKFPSKRGAKTQKEFKIQKAKLVNALLQTNADIIALMEIENDFPDSNSAIYELVDSLNKELPLKKHYQYIKTEPTRINSDAITQGFLYRVERVATYGLFKWLDLNHHKNGIKVRPALLQSFEINGEKVNLVLAHLKSRRGKCADDDDRALVEGACYHVRIRSAQKVKQYISQLDGGTLVLGDLNAYSNELVIKEFEKMGLSGVDNDASYTYSFNGMLGSLDHALFSENLHNKVVSVINWNINSIYPDMFSGLLVDNQNSRNAFRSSDHDMVLIELHSRLSE